MCVYIMRFTIRFEMPHHTMCFSRPRHKPTFTFASSVMRNSGDGKDFEHVQRALWAHNTVVNNLRGPGCVVQETIKAFEFKFVKHEIMITSPLLIIA